MQTLATLDQPESFTQISPGTNVTFHGKVIGRVIKTEITDTEFTFELAITDPKVIALLSCK